MREILFRGKSRLDDKWVYGSLVRIGDFCGIVRPHKDQPLDINQMYPDLYTGRFDVFTTPVKPKTVGQFAGMLDKNNKRIFEGDIIKHGIFEPEIGIVMFANQSFCPLSFNHPCVVTVLGNIHDNPELVEEKG